METDETIKKGFLRLERYAQNIPGGFHCCAEAVSYTHLTLPTKLEV